MNIILLCSFCSCSTTAVNFIPVNHRGTGTISEVVAKKLQKILNDSLNKYKLPALEISIKTRDGKTWTGFAGHYSLERKQAINKNSLFKIGSTTKMFTAALILLYVERGLISLDDPLFKWYPQFLKAKNITVKDLLAHSSGIPEVLRSWSFLVESTIMKKKVWNPSKVMKSMEKKKLLFEPGTQFKYSNTNYILLGLISQKVGKDSIDRLFLKEFFIPLKMKNTYLAPHGRNNLRYPIPGIDVDYIPMGPHVMDPKNSSWDSLVFTAGSMISSAEDLSIWYNSLFNKKVISSSMLKKMLSFNKKMIDPPVKEMIGYGFGVGQFSIANDVYIGHPGVMMGYESIPLYCPDKGHSIIILCNRSKQKSDLMKIFIELKKILKDHEAKKYAQR